MKAFSPEHIAMSLAYDDYYRRAQAIIDKYNPCKITDGKCLAGTPCCGGCEHLGTNGCTVSSLRCKTWLCWKAREAFPECDDQLRELEKENKKHYWLFCYARQSKAQAFENHYYPAHFFEEDCFLEDPEEIRVWSSSNGH